MLTFTPVVRGRVTDRVRNSNPNFLYKLEGETKVGGYIYMLADGKVIEVKDGIITIKLDCHYTIQISVPELEPEDNVQQWPEELKTLEGQSFPNGQNIITRLAKTNFDALTFPV